MRVLLDESVPRKFASELVGHEVRTVPQLGWSGTRNGELLRRAGTEGYEVLVTADQNLEYQQNVSKLAVGVLVLVAKSNRLIHLKPLVPRVLEELPKLRPGVVVRVAGLTRACSGPARDQRVSAERWWAQRHGDPLSEVKLAR